MSEVLPGEIYLARNGSRKTRPFVILSQSTFNRGHYCLAVPFTTGRLAQRRDLPNCVFFRKGTFGLAKSCVAQAEALTLIRKSDFVQPLSRLGKVSQVRMTALVAAVGYVIGADCKPLAAPRPTQGAG
ncbi:type II toxin-antitoxin system PemK/MazF family toxin [Candidatus Palauibacter sp.]|uniref:type II toxin-antitoxin system PemK/MazF family toxin n=1 Tax=Candidatus Palauibacter sp. TaxID=3101350 RepID=UPI003AF21CCE